MELYEELEQGDHSLPEELGGQTVIYGLNGGTSMYAITGEPVEFSKAEVPKRDPEGHIVVNAANGLPCCSQRVCHLRKHEL